MPNESSVEPPSDGGPDFYHRHPVDSARFISNRAQLKAARRALALHPQMGDFFAFQMSEIIGEGFSKGSDQPRTTSIVAARFQDGKLVDLFPDLRELEL